MSQGCEARAIQPYGLAEAFDAFLCRNHFAGKVEAARESDAGRRARFTISRCGVCQTARRGTETSRSQQDVRQIEMRMQIARTKFDKRLKSSTSRWQISTLHCLTGVVTQPVQDWRRLR